jgi:hypothetical protein
MGFATILADDGSYKTASRDDWITRWSNVNHVSAEPIGEEMGNDGRHVCWVIYDDFPRCGQGRGQAEGQYMKSMVSIVLLFAGFAVAPAATAAENLFRGKLWVVPTTQGATFPVPKAKPDVWFNARHISLFASAPSPDIPSPQVNMTVGGLLNSASNSVPNVTKLTFSGLTNPNINAAVTENTVTNNSTSTKCGNFGIYIEFTGEVYLVQGQYMYIGHDEGVSLKIDNAMVKPVDYSDIGLDRWNFAGTTGVHKIDLVYSNLCGGAFLSFGPAM